ncbi:Theileria-specific conserved protein, putative [Theileria annulata]|uniref:Theileria-specific conserved protein, putative n=1 Tax=Theileria annulata TaxID=5874 RepID=Q4UBD4_THEAN|nr:Theileria-specific conserved protein, putative [Theileria annulata]CAI75867.1 Theileria-specific conserved protein, putative [Theileria annulata]|eukprot:XP_955343.1 Theileria-specific conserved protein, putative [Theileria annulata]
MVSLLILTIFVLPSACLELFLPSKNFDKDSFHIYQNINYNHSVFYAAHVTHVYVKYESKTDDLIRRVFYHGVEIFHDQDERDPDFRRIVNYTIMGSRVVISILPTVGDKPPSFEEYEAYYFIDHGCMYDLAHNVPHSIRVENRSNAVKEDDIYIFLERRFTHGILATMPVMAIRKLFRFFFPRRIIEEDTDDSTTDTSSEQSTDVSSDTSEDVFSGSSVKYVDETVSEDLEESFAPATSRLPRIAEDRYDEYQLRGNLEGEDEEDEFENSEKEQITIIDPKDTLSMKLNLQSNLKL